MGKGTGKRATKLTRQQEEAAFKDFEAWIAKEIPSLEEIAKRLDAP